jgi:hypothetical protein
MTLFARPFLRTQGKLAAMGIGVAIPALGEILDGKVPRTSLPSFSLGGGVACLAAERGMQPPQRETGRRMIEASRPFLIPTARGMAGFARFDKPAFVGVRVT